MYPQKSITKIFGQEKKLNKQKSIKFSDWLGFKFMAIQINT